MNTSGRRRLVLAGGSGFLGEVLAAYFVRRGWDVVILTRNPRGAARGGSAVDGLRPAVRWVEWDGATLGAWEREVDGAAAWINLAGQSVNCRYHAANRKTLVASRVEPTRVLGLALARCAAPPPVWLNASTATIYRHTHGPAWDESGEIGSDPAAKDAFSIEIATAWEREFQAVSAPRTRRVLLRTAMVLGRGANSVFPTLARLVRMGLGGAMAGGRQYVSWIHQEDFCRVVEWLIEPPTSGTTALEGIVNVAAPGPVTNAELMATLRAACGRSWGLPAAAWMLEVGAFLMRTETELVIKSRRVISRRLAEAGFEFRFPTLAGAVADLVRPAAESNGIR